MVSGGLVKLLADNGEQSSVVGCLHCPQSQPEPQNNPTNSKTQGLTQRQTEGTPHTVAEFSRKVIQKVETNLKEMLLPKVLVQTCSKHMQHQVGNITRPDITLPNIYQSFKLSNFAQQSNLETNN